MKNESLSAEARSQSQKYHRQLHEQYAPPAVGPRHEPSREIPLRWPFILLDGDLLSDLDCRSSGATISFTKTELLSPAR